jgi:hypothetical protein
MLCRIACSVFVLASFASAAESDALAISERLVARHLPFGTVLDPFLDANGQTTGFTRCGDSAIWTGHWLAAEAFRYRVTRDEAALRNVFAGLFGIRLLVDVTGNDLLARCVVPTGSPFAAGILREEQNNRNYPGKCLAVDCRWVGNTSRDQYTGVFFGLGVVWDLVDNPTARATVRELVNRMLTRLDEDDFAVKMPDGDTSTVFWLRTDQKLMLFLIGRAVDPARWGSRYSRERLFQAPFVSAAVATDVLDPHNSYFKFNLNAIAYYHLNRYETNASWRSFYRRAYDLQRRTVDDHGNAHFNLIDRAIAGADPRRDAETRTLLEQWLTRSRRDERVDYRGILPSCRDEDRACAAIPVPLRVRTDFLWQRSPFLLFGGGAGNIEGAGIDYLLPYWMARYFGVL